MNYLRLLLLPVGILYGTGMLIRNLLYDLGIFPSKEFGKGVIVIGNLSAGGTGKSPMTEYLIRLLKGAFPLATLSRGYKRHTQGFLIAEKDSTSFQIGDEPLQFRKKFSDIVVAVDENRRHGIQQLFARFPELKTILLDDAFQHRRVKAGLSLLLTDYENMFYNDWLLPAGTLREWGMGKKRADAIVVTKCPDNISPVEKRIVIKKVNPDPHQQVFFSHIRYGNLIPLQANGKVKQAEELKETQVVLLTGISNPRPLETYLRTRTQKVTTQFYPDHHEYSMVEVNRLKEIFESIPSADKIIVTTEKDAMRLDKPGLMEVLTPLPVYYIPIEMTFDEHEKEEFDKMVKDYVVRTNRNLPR